MAKATATDTIEWTLDGGETSTAGSFVIRGSIVHVNQEVVGIKTGLHALFVDGNSSLTAHVNYDCKFEVSIFRLERHCYARVNTLHVLLPSFWLRPGHVQSLQALHRIECLPGCRLGVCLLLVCRMLRQPALLKAVRDLVYDGKK